MRTSACCGACIFVHVTSVKHIHWQLCLATTMSASEMSPLPDADVHADGVEQWPSAEVCAGGKPQKYYQHSSREAELRVCLNTPSKSITAAMRAGAVRQKPVDLEEHNVWRYLLRLQPDHPAYAAGWTHVCCYEHAEPDQPDQYCNTFMKLFRNATRGNQWIVNKGIEHFTIAHPESEIAMKSKGKTAEQHEVKVNLMSRLSVEEEGLNEHCEGGGGGKRERDPELGMAIQKPSTVTFRLQPHDKCLALQARWYCYAKMRVSKDAMQDPYFLAMLNWNTIPQSPAPKMEPRQLCRWVRAEFGVFKMFLKYMLQLKFQHSKGNAFAQGLHDCGTLENHEKFLALGIQFIDPKWFRNWVICLSCTCSFRGGTDVVIANLIEEIVKEVTGYSVEELLMALVQDRAALGVADELAFEAEACLMHDDDKLGLAAYGGLTRSKNKVVVNPFKQGQKFLEGIRSLVKHFSYGYRAKDLKKTCTQAGGALIKLELETTGTRQVGACKNMLTSLIRVSKGVRLYLAGAQGDVRDLDKPGHDTFTKENYPSLSKVTPTDAQWQTVVEWEAILRITKHGSTFAQREKAFCGGYKPVIMILTMKHLTAPQIAVVDLAAVGPSPHLPMKIVDVSSMTALGQECRERAIIEGQRRFCGSDSDVILDENQCPAVKCSDRDLQAVMLDLRLVCGNFLSRPQRELAVRLLKEAYIDFSTKAWHYDNTVHTHTTLSRTLCPFFLSLSLSLSCKTRCMNDYLLL